MRCGLGSTDVTALAEAFLGNQIKPQFPQSVQFETGFGFPSTFSPYYYMDDATAQQIASLLNGSVIQQQPPPPASGGTPLPNSGPGIGPTPAGNILPDANYIQLPDGSFNPGYDLFGGTILSFFDLCDAANEFAQIVPGGVVGSSCSQAGQTTPAADYQTEYQSAVATGAPAPSPAIPAPVLQTTPVSLPAAPLTQQSTLTAVAPSTSQVVSATPGASTAAASSSDLVVGGIDLSQIPTWGWLLAGGLALWAFWPSGR